MHDPTRLPARPFATQRPTHTGGPLARPDERLAPDAIWFGLMHLAPLGALWTGARPIDWLVCAALVWVRLFGITGGFHRYFSHRSFKTSRPFAFALAWLGTSSAQKGVLWWAGHHRNHHRWSDTEHDLHSPRRGFWWSHVGWILCNRYDETPDTIRDFARHPEIAWLDRHAFVPPTPAIAVWATLGWSGLFIGFFLSTVILYHLTFSVNSVVHVFGSRRYATTDTSRNNWLIGLLALGEGWHNNHHYYQASVRQGFFWWEIDVTYYVLRALAALGVVWDLKVPSERVLAGHRIPRSSRAAERPTPTLLPAEEELPAQAA